MKRTKTSQKGKSQLSLTREIVSFVIVGLLLMPSVIGVPTVSAQTTPVTDAIANFYRAMGNEEYAGYWSDTGNMIQNTKERLNRMLQLVNLLGTIIAQRGIVAEPTPPGQGTFVDLDANGIDGPAFINAGGSLALSWRSAGVESCEGTSNKTTTANWGGADMATTSGVKAIAGVTESTLFKLKCKAIGSSAKVVDTVVVNVLGKEAVEDEPTITVTAPNGGESLEKSKTTEILWTSTSDVSRVNIGIETYTDSGELIDYRIINSDTPNDGSHSWIIGNTTEGEISGDLGYKYKIRLSRVGESGIYDESDSYFTITSSNTTPAPTPTPTPTPTPVPTTITVLNPDGGEVWTVGELRNIRWTTNASESAKIRIRLINADSDENMIIAAGLPNSGKYEWTVGNYNFTQVAPAGSKYKVAVCVMKTDNTEGVCDRSNARFTIKAQPVSVAGQADLVAAVGSLQQLLAGLSSLLQAR